MFTARRTDRGIERREVFAATDTRKEKEFCQRIPKIKRKMFASLSQKKTNTEGSSELDAYIPYRKHSSGDLQSRLKTRKILGVGETDNGDVHRSKISQVLGHNEHLFVKFPRCYWLWHLSMAIIFTAAGVTHIFSPIHPMQKPMDKSLSSLNMMTSFYGSVLLGFAFLLWNFFGTTDKSLARNLMAAIIISQFSQTVAILNYAIRYNKSWDNKTNYDICIHLFLLLGSMYFFWAIGSSKAGLRRTHSNKDLRQPSPEDMLQAPSSPSALGDKKSE